MPQSKRRRGQKRNNAKSNGAPQANESQQDYGTGAAPGTGSGSGPNGPGVGAASATGQRIDNGNNGNTASSRPPASTGSTNTTLTTTSATITTSGQTAASQQRASYPDNVPLSAVAAPATNQRDTRSGNPRPQPDSRNANGSRRGGGPKSTAPGKEPKGAPPQATNAQKVPVAAVPLVASENNAQSQRPGTHGATATSHAKAGGQENIPPNVQVDQLHTTMQDLSLGTPPAPATAQVDNQGPMAIGADRGGPEAPVPLIVPYPGANKQPAPKSQGLPTPLGVDLPGLIEPKTEEERREREYHLQFMREALRMVSLCLHSLRLIGVSPTITSLDDFLACLSMHNSHCFVSLVS